MSKGQELYVVGNFFADFKKTPKEICNICPTDVKIKNGPLTLITDVFGKEVKVTTQVTAVVKKQLGHLTDEEADKSMGLSAKQTAAIFKQITPGTTNRDLITLIYSNQLRHGTSRAAVPKAPFARVRHLKRGTSGPGRAPSKA